MLTIKVTMLIRLQPDWQMLQMARRCLSLVITTKTKKLSPWRTLKPIIMRLNGLLIWPTGHNNRAGCEFYAPDFCKWVHDTIRCSQDRAGVINQLGLEYSTGGVDFIHIFQTTKLYKMRQRKNMEECGGTFYHARITD